ncbi:MAG: hypothetical protein CMI85_06560 [Candidatus Pelagibacter sp.]|nr:hypothetical protein [Candidatus Pelagibacter sp.]
MKQKVKSDEADKIKNLEAKIEKLTSEIENLRYTLLNHINFIEDTYAPLKKPIEKMKSFFR